MSSDSMMDFFFKQLPVTTDPDLLASLDPICDFIPWNGTDEINQPAARRVFAYIFGIPSALYLFISIPIMLARRNIFPLTLKSPVLALGLAIGFLCIQMIAFWVDITGYADYPCWLGAVTRALFGPLSMLTFVTELFRIRAKVRFSTALEKLEAATTPEEKEAMATALRKAKNHIGWRTDVQSMALCLTPSTIYFFVVVFPDPLIQAGCVGCGLGSTENFVLMSIVFFCMAMVFYLLRTLRDYKDEIGLKRDVKYITSFCLLMGVVFQSWIFLFPDKFSYLNKSLLLVIAHVYANYIYTLRPTLMTFPWIQNRVLAKRKQRLGKSKFKAGGMCSSLCRRYQVSPGDGGTGKTTIPVTLTFNDVLEVPEGLELFKQHLASEFNKENILFWERATGWVRTYDDAPVETREAEAMQIYKCHICDSALMQINLNNHQFADLRNVFVPGKGKPALTAEKTVYDAAIHEIYLLMERDMFPRFAASARYALALAAVQKARGQSAKGSKFVSGLKNLASNIGIAKIGSAYAGSQVPTPSQLPSTSQIHVLGE